MIKAIKSQNEYDFEKEVNELLANGYDLLNSNCGENEWGVITFTAILKKAKQEEQNVKN